jgi:hypothetical protein
MTRSKRSPKKPTRRDLRLAVSLSPEERTLIALYRLAAPYVQPIVRRVAWQGLSAADQRYVEDFYPSTMEDLRLSDRENVFAGFCRPLDDECAESLVHVLGHPPSSEDAA